MVTTKGKQPPTLEQRVLRFIQEHNLVLSQHRLLVAVSGGPDSVCLLHILVKLQKELDIQLHVAHLNHQLRGAEAEADAQYVSDLAHHLGIPATIEQRDVRAYQAGQHLSLEEAARDHKLPPFVQLSATGWENATITNTQGVPQGVPRRPVLVQ